MKALFSRRRAVGLLILAAALLGAWSAAADGGYQIDLFSVAPGGTAAGGAYALAALAGQWEAGSAAGGGYVLTGGFLAGVGSPSTVYLPIIVGP